MKIIPIIFFFIFPPFVSGEIKNPYKTLKFDKVIMYDFSGGKDWNEYIVNDKGQLASSIKKQVQLDYITIQNLTDMLGKKSSFGAGEAACFVPHLGFVFYLKGEIMAYITVCLDCNGLVSSKPLDAQKQGKIGEGKDAYYMADGPSKLLRTFLNDLLKKYNFSHQIKGS